MAIQSQPHATGRQSSDSDHRRTPTVPQRTCLYQMASASWDDMQHRLYVKLCLSEVEKGNRPTTYLNKMGWENVQTGIQTELGMVYTLKQLRNHWDAMKLEWKLFKMLKNNYTGLGWNELTKTIEADDQWWKDRIKENKQFKKFQNKDLSIYWYAYDGLFSDVVATGSRARVPSQRSSIGEDLNDEFDDFNQVDDGKEGSGDSDEDTQQPTQLFPSCSMKSSKSSGSKRKKSGAETVREGIDTLVAAMSCRSTSTTGATNDASLDEALCLLDAMCDGNFADLHPLSNLYFFAQQYILNKGNRTIFLKARTNEHRYGQLQYNYEIFITRKAI